MENPNAYKPNAVRSMCCRLQLDLRELLKRGNGLFGSAEMTGSIGVVTLNMARLGYLYEGDKEALFSRLDELLALAKSTLEKKRQFIQEMYDRGLYPYTKRYLPHFRNHFSTIGVNGMNEMIRNFTNDQEDITTNFGHEFSMEVLQHIRNRMKEFQEETGNLYNLEATPAEGTTYRFAKEDKKRYPNIVQAGSDDNIYYTNSSQIPVDFTQDPFEALLMQDELQCQYTGGTVLHLYMNERISTSEACKNFAQRTAAPSTIYADDGTGIGYQGIELMQDDVLVVNDVTVQRLGGTAQNVQDATSIATYFQHSGIRTGILVQSDTEALNQAQMLLATRKDSTLRISSLSLNLFDPTASTRIVAGLNTDIFDPIQVTKSMPGNTTITKTLFVQSINHDMTKRSFDTKLITAEPIIKAFVLNDPQEGVLDSNNGFLSY